MKLHKTLLSMSALAMSMAAYSQYASAELALVVDDGDTTAAHPAQVERYDPYTGAYLGAFGAGYFQGTAFGVTVVGQNAYVNDIIPVGSTFYSRIDEFNFSTGAYQGTTFNTGPFELTSTNFYGGNLVCTDYGTGTSLGVIWTLSSTGGNVSQTTLPTGAFARQSVIVGSQLWVACASTSGASGMLVYNLNSNGSINGSPTSVGVGTSFTGVTTAIVNGTQFVYGSGVMSSSGSAVVEKFTTGGALNSTATVASSQQWSLATGHNGIVYSLDTTNKKVSRFDGGNSFGFGPLGSFALSQSANPQSIGVYAAPEPAPVLGLGLGAIALFGFRRSRKLQRKA